MPLEAACGPFARPVQAPTPRGTLAIGQRPKSAFGKLQMGQRSIPKRSAESHAFPSMPRRRSRTAHTPVISTGPGVPLGPEMQTLNWIQTVPPHYHLVDCRAIDGDTIEASVKLPLNVSVRKRIRLKGFYSNEHQGENPDAAHAAQQRLQQALDGHIIHLLTRGSKEDQYGRICGHLFVDGHGVTGSQILGDLQLSEQSHAADLRIAKRNIASARRGTNT